MTLSTPHCVWHDSFLHVAWFISTFDIIHFYRRQWSPRVCLRSWLPHRHSTRDMIHSYVWHLSTAGSDLAIVPSLVTLSPPQSVWHDSPTCNRIRFYRRQRSPRMCIHSLLPRVKIHLYAWHDSFLQEAVISPCMHSLMTPSPPKYTWHNSFLRVT